MRAFIRASALCVVLLFLAGASLAPAAEDVPPLRSFTTGGHAVYYLSPAKVTEDGPRAVVSAAFDGYVLCHTGAGELLWRTPTGGALPRDLAVSDIDGDSLDEALVASADGALYAIDHDGALMWVFKRPPPLHQVAVARPADGSPVILTGGVEQVLYALSPHGKVLRTLKTEHSIRHLRTGDILGTGNPYAAVATASRGLSGDLSLLLVDPQTLKVIWKRTGLGSFAFNSGRRFFSMLLVDLDKDGKQEIVLSDGWGEHGKIFAFDHQGRQLWTRSDKRIPNVPYRMNLLSHVTLPDDEFLLGHFANIFILYELDGSCREVLTAPYAFANSAYDPETRTLYLGSAVSGGDAIHAVRLDRSGWRAALEKMRSVGRLARIEDNLRGLAEQVRRFRRPAYQPEPREIVVLARRPENRTYQRLRFVDRITLSQKITDPSELWCRSLDRRRRYDLSAEEIVQLARAREADGADFAIWAGHGHAVYMPLSTMERILKAAPRRFYGFLFAEMEGVDAELAEVVDKILVPLAEACRKHGKKMIFLNKNIFYNGPIYVPFWRRLLLNPRFRDVVVPALEETNSRTPEMSLSGRIGLWLTGRVNTWACRMVTDNACFDRMWEFSSQQVLSHHLRHLISRASLGATVFINNIHQGPFTRALERQLTPFYDMLERGAVHVPQPNELLSVSPVCLGMSSSPAAAYIRHGINGHNYRYPADEHPPLVFDRLDCYWAGAPTLPHDFSRYGLGVRWRGADFLPEMPYGLVAMVPDDASLNRPFRRKITTDGRWFYDVAGNRHGPAEYRPVVEAQLEDGAVALPVRVEGRVHWTVVRLDPSHIRVTLIDPGYFEPDEREAEILLQHIRGRRASDVLTGEALAIRRGHIQVRVPAGSVRIIDIEQEP